MAATSSTNPILTEAAARRALDRYNDARATGLRVEWAREAARLTRGQLAELVGTSRRTIHRVETGARILTPAERVLVARGLGVSIDYLTVGAANGAAR